MAVVKPTLSGSFRLFRVAGIQVYLHWSWLLVGYLELQFRSSAYTSKVWAIAEYLTLFAIVLLHEFGHAFACRQVGGQANEIVLWPLGGIAFVSPPPRPGALLWSVAAGPLVNALLVPVTVGAFMFGHYQGLAETNPDAYHFLLYAGVYMNLVLLIFNMMPIYPLDGGQILQSLLWFIMGQSRSLMVVCVIGMVAAVGIVLLAVLRMSIWLGLIALFTIFRCWAGFRQARLLAAIENSPRHGDAACPFCGAHPFAGNLWSCDQCHTRFDTFQHMGVCPHCRKVFPTTACLECRGSSPIDTWFEQAAADGREPERD
jgi:Zn-dependent protease